MSYGECVECEHVYSDEFLNICEKCGVSVCNEHYNKETEMCDQCNETNKGE